MILNVKKSNFLIYTISLCVGLSLIVISIILERKGFSGITSNVLLAIGSSTIPTVVTAYFIDQANEKRNKTKILELRDDFLWGMPHGLLWIMKVIIEMYLPYNSKGKSVYDTFKEAIAFMRRVDYKDEDYLQQSKDIDSLLNESNLGYGLSLCLRDCKSILDHEYELEINSIFDKAELLSIRYLFEECEIIKKAYIVSDMAEYIELFVDNTIDHIKEVKVKTDRLLVLENHRITNWIELSK